MSMDESPSWFSSGVRGPRVILGGMLLCAAFGLLSFRSDKELFNYIGIGATVLVLFAYVALVVMLVIRQRKIFVRNFLLGTIVYFGVACLWRWRTLAYKDATTLWVNLLWVLVGAALFNIFFEATRLVLPPRASPRHPLKRLTSLS